jgi:rhodanese-related sulfurtransferase
MKKVANPQLIDVRTPEEFKEGHLPGAILIDIKEPDFDKVILNLDAEQPVFVYCRSGRRSLKAAKILEKNKFRVVYNLAGGINAWKGKDKAVTIPE